VANGVRVRFKGGRIATPKLDNGPLTRIGNDMVAAQKKRWAFGVNSDGTAAKPLAVKYLIQKAKYTGNPNPIRDMKMTGRTLENFQLRKAMDGTIRAENTTRLERQKATQAQQWEDMIGFAPTDQIAVFRSADAEYDRWLQKAWVPLR
jgi:hypothetical protein